MSRRRYKRPRSAAQVARDRAHIEAAQRETERLRAVIAGLPPAPPDPARFTAPGEVAQMQKAWEEWHRSLTEEQRHALRVAHHRAILQGHRGGV